MRRLHIDIETYSKVDVGDVGAHRYAEDDSFRIILFAYAWDNEPVHVLDMHGDCFPGESLPADVWKGLTDPGVEKLAHNANFEITCISTYYGIELDTAQWTCTMIAAAYLGLPLGLDKLGKVLNLVQKKDARGKALIIFFCKPCRPTKKNGFREVNTPEDDPEKWAVFGEYCGQDVDTERDVHKYICKFPRLPQQEVAYWQQDQKIGNAGIAIDVEFIEKAIKINNKVVGEIREKMVEITGVDNPNSVAQLKKWVQNEIGEEVSSMGKEYLAEAIEADTLPTNVIDVLKLRGAGNKTSASKYGTMLAYKCKDGRVRDLLQFYGANRTGRFSGRGIQIQNLKKTIHGDLATAKQAVVKGLAELLYDDVTDLISRLVRTAFVAAPGKTLCVSDFSAIEARVVAWIAGEEWVLDVFRTHGKIYEATASNMFHVPLDMVTKGSDLRAKGKVAALALGYQGASGALIKMGALREGLTEEELPAIVSGWRSANPHIVKLWRDVENAARYAIENRTSCVVRKSYCTLKFSYDRGYLFIELPSSRRLAYYGATIEGRNTICYWGVDQVKRIWVKMQAYGGLLTENITQAIARDCLCDVMFRMRNLDILMHIHDEIVVEVEDEKAEETLGIMNYYMSISPLWAKGLPLKGDGYISKYYKKD